VRLHLNHCAIHLPIIIPGVLVVGVPIVVESGLGWEVDFLDTALLD
jgi:hypothetical protein